jgi:U3 small nucleolar RNA-associated protein 5
MAPKQPQAGPSRIKASSTQAPPPPVSVAAFNPSRTLFACAQPVLGSADKLTVWDVVADRVIAEWEVEGAAKATTVVWSSISDAAKKKKRRKSGSGHEGDEDVVAITTDKGSLVVFAPRRGEVLRRLDVGRVHAAASNDRLVLVTAKDILVIDRDLSAIANTFPLPAGATTPTAATILPSESDIIHLLIASASVISIHISLDQDKLAHSSSPLPVSTSHVSSLVSLPPSSHGHSFLVLCEDDRTVSQYTLPQPSAQAKLSYRYSSPTISPVHSVSTTPDLISVLHSSGEVSLFPTPTELDFVRPKSDSRPSLVKVVEGKEDSPVRLVGATFSSEDDAAGSLLCGRIFGGGRVKWLKAVYERPEGGVKAETVVKTDAQDLASSAAAQNVSSPIRFCCRADDSLYLFNALPHLLPTSRRRHQRTSPQQLFPPTSTKPTCLSASDCWRCQTVKTHLRRTRPPCQRSTGRSTPLR